MNKNMHNLIDELIGKKVYIAFSNELYRNGGVAAAEYEVLGGVDGFIKLRKSDGKVYYYNQTKIDRIVLLN